MSLSLSLDIYTYIYMYIYIYIHIILTTNRMGRAWKVVLYSSCRLSVNIVLT